MGLSSSLSKAEAEARILKLRELINDYRYHYHVLDESIMSESAADSLKHELTLLEEKFPELITQILRLKELLVNLWINLVR